MLSRPDSPSKRAWMYENLDVPEVVNFMADTVLYRAWDSGGKNFYLVRDIDGQRSLADPALGSRRGSQWRERPEG